ncbi:MAG: DUF2493 domain-containing protein [Gemmatimonadaceae bacterium]|nr:DUF2493 domain-containing protein [Gemmatimonadaceae bacterium]
MKVIIAGSRTLNDPALVEDAARKSGFLISEVVCGCANGIDTLGDLWAQAHGTPVKHFPAGENFVLSADLGGFARNGEMAAYADALILIWNTVSGGSANMLQQARFQQRTRPFPIYQLVPSF